MNASESTPAESHPAAFQYAAFISYRHLPRDMEVAQRVQKFVESFRLPRNIALPADTNWAHPGKTLGKCFRDEDELPTTHSLPKSIGDALAQSHSLIVICSPETGKSPWVRQEIETFIQLHGRERIICVLAAGSPKESIPAVLKSRFAPDIHGAIREMPAHPLAADMRKTDLAHERTELLKVIAGIAGCGLDDLKQREKTRRRRRATIFGLFITFIAGIIAALSLIAYNVSQGALLSESKNLAALSQEQLARGERIQALETALSALPESEQHPNRPIANEAVAALEEALDLDVYPPKLWHPTFAADLGGEIISIESSPEGGWVAALDASGTISVFDAFDGHMLSSINLRKFAYDPVTIDAWTWTMKASGTDNLLIASADKNCDFVCMDVRKNQVVWDFGTLPIDGLAVSENSVFCAAATITDETNPLGQGNLVAAVIDASNGDLVYPYSTDYPDVFIDLDPREVNEQGRHVLEIFHPYIIADDGSATCFGYGKYAVFLDQHLGYTFIDFGNTKLFSLAITGDLLLGATSALNPEGKDYNHLYTFGAYNISGPTLGDPLWTVDGTFTPTVSGGPFSSHTYFGSPTIHCIAQMNEQTVAVCSAGNVLRLLSVESGEEIYSEVFPSSIVSVGTLFLGDNGNLAIVLSNGTLDFRMPFEPTSAAISDTFQHSIPYQVEEAVVEEFKDTLMVATIKPANQPDRLLCYRLKLAYGDPVDYSLDELIAQAHELLAAE